MLSISDRLPADALLPKGDVFKRAFAGTNRDESGFPVGSGRGDDTLTIRAMWFLLRTALCRAVMPSFVRKSRCAPPFFSTLMSSAHPSSCTASVRGHSEGEQANNQMRNDSIIHIWWKVGGSFRDSVFGRPFWPPALLSRSTVRPQVIQQGNLLQGWTIICINPRRLAGHVIPLWPARRWLISENPTHFAVELGRVTAGEKPGTVPYLLCLDRGSSGPGLYPGTLKPSRCSSAAHAP